MKRNRGSEVRAAQKHPVRNQHIVPLGLAVADDGVEEVAYQDAGQEIRGNRNRKECDHGQK